MNTIPKKKKHQFLPEQFRVTQWADVQPFYAQLFARELTSLAALRQWFLDRSELEGALSEEAGWRYINMTRDTTHEGHKAKYEAYVTEILPQIIPAAHHLNEKAKACPYTQSLSQEVGFAILLRCIESSLQIYRAENIPLFTQIALKAQKYGEVSGAMTIVLQGKEHTLQQAAVHLESQDRPLRKEVYGQIGQRRLQDKDMLDDLYTSLIKDRHQIAANAGFANFRDYSFVAMNRFDYTPQDCFTFHKAVEERVVPMLNKLATERKDSLALDALKPWDKQVDVANGAPLRPFTNTEALLKKTIAAFDRLDPFLGDCLRTMQEMGHLDLESRKGKAPGGYNYPLDETGVPFIFMNATATLGDMVTLLHEGGHAVHSFLVKDFPIHDFKHCTSEVAELASMSMELLTMDHWDLFFEDEGDLKRAKKKHLVQILETLAWVAIVDKFQHWVYEHPGHTSEERRVAWNTLFDTFSDSITDWAGQEHYKDALWQRQLHLFEVPFYYIEYGIAQLGAVAVWKRYKENPEQGLQAYLAALKLGYTQTIPQVYQTAGVKFDFGSAYIGELIGFLQTEINTLD
jgi:oligoendopeptidase F